MIIFLPSPFFFGYDGATWHPKLIFISNDHKHNTSLIEHEKKHARQMEQDGWLTWWKNHIFDKEKRYQYELEAYAISSIVKPYSFDWFVDFLKNNYNIDKTRQQVYEDLTAEIEKQRVGYAITN